MAEMEGGSLSFKATLDNEQLDKALQETIKRVQGVSNAVVGMGDTMDASTAEIVECIQIQQQVIRDLEASVADLDTKIVSMQPGQAQEVLKQQAVEARAELDAEKQGLQELIAELQSMQAVNAGTALSMEQIRSALSQIGAACEVHENELARLQDEYEGLSTKMGNAFKSGRDDEFRALQNRRQELSGEIRVRKQLLTELRQQSDALEAEADKLTEAANAAKQAGNQHVLLRTKIRNLREEMAALVASGVSEQSAEYKKMADELGRLTDLQGDISQQGKVLANDEAGFAGVISGISGVAGAFGAAQGAVALFAGENENLQKIMLKVQSLLAITINLQQVAQAVNKDSAFMLVTVNKAKQWWNNLLAIGRGEQIAATAATVADTAATVADTAATNTNTAAMGRNTAAQAANAASQGASTAAQVAGTAATGAATAANIGLAGAFRMVGAAIKSIPVIGWVLAGVSALIGLISALTKRSREAKKAAEEMHKSIAENAYKPIGKIQELSVKWKQLGDNMDAKKQFILDNKKAFEELGVSINGVTEAENLLVVATEDFIEAKIQEAKAMSLIQKAQEKTKEVVDLDAKRQSYAGSQKWVIDGTTKGGHQTGHYEQMSEAEIDNLPEVKKIMKKREDLVAEITNLYNEAAGAERKGGELLKNAGIDAIDGYKVGSLGAIQQAIQEKQAALKDAMTSAEYAAIIKEIEELKKQEVAITGEKGKSTTKDHFIENLEKRKAEYQRFLKWMNSGDAILQQSASKEFAGLLKEGASYIEYLKKQRDQILSIEPEKRSSTQNANLVKLNNAIADETKKTVMDEFNESLQGELAAANSVIEKLTIIQQKREELKGDGTDLEIEQADTLNSEEEKLQKQMQQETDALLEEYAGYVQRKRKLEEDFNRDIALLERQRTQATTEEEIAAVDAAIANRKQKYQQDTKGSGNANYDALLQEYGNFEQKKQAIIDDFDGKRRIAQEQGNTELVDSLNKAQNEALSGLALDELRANPDWALMFEDLDDITTEKLQELVNKINSLDGAYLGVNFNPQDLAVLKDKVKEMQKEIQTRNPFKGLVNGLKDYAKAADKESKKGSLTAIFSSATDIMNLASGTLKAVTDGLKEMGVEMDAETEKIIGDIGGIMDGAGQIAAGIASGNPLAVIQGSIQLLTAAFDLFNQKDREARKRIEEHEESIERLGKAYERLERAVSKALGTDVYDLQKQQIDNLEQQIQHLNEAAALEEGLKKSDSEKVEDYRNQAEAAANEIEDIYAAMAEDILQTNAKDLASEFGDSLIAAWQRGEDGARAFEETANNVIRNALINMLKKQFLEKQMQTALDGLAKSMGLQEDGTFNFDGLSEGEIEAFKSAMEDAMGGFKEAYDAIAGSMPELMGGDESLSGAVKGVTEETANIVAGQMNAIRINQLEATQVLRQQLVELNAIAQNTQFNRHLVKIDRIISLLESTNNGRSQGLS